MPPVHAPCVERVIVGAVLASSMHPEENRQVFYHSRAWENSVPAIRTTISSASCHPGEPRARGAAGKGSGQPEDHRQDTGSQRHRAKSDRKRRHHQPHREPHLPAICRHLPARVLPSAGNMPAGGLPGALPGDGEVGGQVAACAGLRQPCTNLACWPICWRYSQPHCRLHPGRHRRPADNTAPLARASRPRHRQARPSAAM